MAAVKGVNRTKADLPIGSSILGQATSDAKVCMIYDTYEASALENASTIAMGTKLPVGARVINVILYSDDMGSTVTCDVGDADDADRYLDGINVTNANDVHSLLGADTRLGEIDGFGYVVLGTGAVSGGDDTQVIITTAGIWTGTLKLMVIYAI